MTMTADWGTPPADSYIPMVDPYTVALFTADGRVFFDLDQFVLLALDHFVLPGTLSVSLMPDGELPTQLQSAYVLGLAEFLESVEVQIRGMRESFRAHEPEAQR